MTGGYCEEFLAGLPSQDTPRSAIDLSRDPCQLLSRLCAHSHHVRCVDGLRAPSKLVRSAQDASPPTDSIRVAIAVSRLGPCSVRSRGEERDG